MLLLGLFQDDGRHPDPTYDNILAGFRKLVSESSAGDSVFFHYSGHGGRVRDEDGDEEDGYDETLIPVDYQSSGQITDDIVYSELVGRMPEGSTLTCLMDCCHSGSILDLPYMFKADGEQSEMGFNPNSHLDQLKRKALLFLIARIFGSGMVAQLCTTALLSGGCSGSNSMGMIQGVSSVLCAR